jgi:hypothetical protein
LDHAGEIDFSAVIFHHKSDANGLGLQNQPAGCGEALSYNFDGKVLNPNSVEIDLPFQVFKRLNKLHLLERDRKTGMRRIDRCLFGLMDLWKGVDFRPDRKFRAFRSQLSAGMFEGQRIRKLCATRTQFFSAAIPEK